VDEVVVAGVTELGGGGATGGMVAVGVVIGAVFVTGPAVTAGAGEVEVPDPEGRGPAPWPWFTGAQVFETASNAYPPGQEVMSVLGDPPSRCSRRVV
jgi:hypothetical protein